MSNTRVPLSNTKVQLPNGNLLMIEGGNAQQVANVVNEYLTRNVPGMSTAASVEEALPVPLLNFAKEQVQTNAEADDEEAVLALPSTL